MPLICPRAASPPQKKTQSAPRKAGAAALAVVLLAGAGWLSTQQPRPSGAPAAALAAAAAAGPPEFAASLEATRLHNEATRRNVSKWIRREEWASPPSLISYGLPPWSPRIFDLVDRDVGGVPIVHDLVSWLGRALEGRLGSIGYLEVGVSVGKCLATQLRALRPASDVYALDVEDINPSLARLLDAGPTLAEWTDEAMPPGGAPNLRRTAKACAHGHGVDSVREFRLAGAPAGAAPRLRYVACDEFNAVGWDRLAELRPRFQLVRGFVCRACLCVCRVRRHGCI
jgi:hypothetical protein